MSSVVTRLLAAIQHGDARCGEELLPLGFQELRQARSLLGATLLAQKKYAEAEPLLVAGTEGLQQRAAKIPAPDKARLAEAIASLTQLYDETNQPDKAAAWRAKLPK